jgi:serine/threonine-protein kinase
VTGSTEGTSHATTRHTLRAAGAHDDAGDDARTSLQNRLAALFKIMFWSLVALTGFIRGMYMHYPGIAPHHSLAVFAGAGVGLATMAAIWFLLERKSLSLTALHRIDLIYSAGIGGAFGASAFVQGDLRPSAYASLLYSAFTVYARALIVPSSAARTAVTSVVTFLPMIASAAALAVTRDDLELPGLGFFCSYLLLSVVPIVLSASGSKTIYGLRRRVSAAKQVGQYTLVRQIGEGGMGQVFLAQHVLLRRQTAVKLLPPNRPGNLERFEREVQRTSELTHPNTVVVFDYGRSVEGQFYYAMEYLDGIDLEQLVRKHGHLPNGRIAAILEQVCGALQEAHALSFIHRDIKPANIMLCERGGIPDFVKVVDFGLAKQITPDTGTSTQVILGSPGYIAPEAMTGTIGAAADLYAIGAVGYYLLTGRRVFQGKNALDVCIQTATVPATPPSQVAAHYIQPELEAVLMRCLAKDPHDRYASAADLANALRAIPRDKDWSEDEAHGWWRELRRSEHAEAVTTTTPTVTITVQIDERQRIAAPPPE